MRFKSILVGQSLVLAMILEVGGCKGLPPSASTPIRAQAAATTCVVKVMFKGVICHVFGIGRAAAIRSSGEDHQHDAYLIVPGSVNMVSLTKAIDGLKVAPDPKGFKIGPLDRIAIRVGGYNSQTEKVESLAPPLEKDLTFREDVPDLLFVTDHTMTTLDKEVFGDTPSNLFTAFFELEGGKLFATHYDGKAKFKHDFENRKDRFFADEVTLCGQTTLPPALQFRLGNGPWSDAVTFDNPNLPLDIYLQNVARDPHDNGQHFAMFKHLAAPNSNLTWDDVEPSMTKGMIPGCSDTQWP